MQTVQTIKSDYLLYFKDEAGKVMYVVAPITVIDGKGVCMWSQRSEEEIRAQKAKIGVQLHQCSEDEYEELQRDFYRSGYKEITGERFMEALECLPPLGWCNDGYCESFKFMEAKHDDLTFIFARKGDRYYEFIDSMTMTHAQIMERLDQLLGVHKEAECLESC